ncbi:MAG TPA: sulfite exporter TauE/SafE family protein [Beijerinckiaceae bacterium]|jgi:hypothetical protein
MASDPLFLLVGWLTVLTVSVGKGAFGGGLAMLGIPLLSLVTDPISAAIMMSPLVAFMDVFAVGAFGPSTWSRRDLAWLLPGLLLGIALGTAVVGFVDARIVSLTIAAITLAFTGHYFLRGRLAEPGRMPVKPPLAVAAGAASGFTTFVAHAGGPPVAMYLLARGVPKTVFAGTNVAFFILANVLKLPSYVALGWNRPWVFWAAASLAPAVPVGVWLGKRLHDRLPQNTLFFWCYVVLGAAALKLLADSARALLA